MSDRNIHIVIQRGRIDPATPCDLVPNWEGEFRDHQDWVNFAHKRLTVAIDSNGHQLKAICVDTLGRRCANGRDMQRAHDEGTFPVRYFFECQLTQPAEQTEPSAPFDSLRDEALSALLWAARETVLTYGKPGGPWNVSTEPGGWLCRMRDAIALAESAIPAPYPIIEANTPKAEAAFAAMAPPK